MPNPPNQRNVPGLLRRIRERAELTQRELAKRLQRNQPWVHKCEIGERRVDVSEFLDWCSACESDSHEALRQLIRQSK